MSEGSVRLRGGFGSRCDPVHSGFIEVFHLGEWGNVYTGGGQRNSAGRLRVPEVVCRQLGFTHGARVDPFTTLKRRPPPPSDPEADSTTYTRYYYDYGIVEEGEEPLERTWLANVICSGSEQELSACELDRGFRNDSPRLGVGARVIIACRQFPLVEAIDTDTSLGMPCQLDVHNTADRSIRHTRTASLNGRERPTRLIGATFARARKGSYSSHMHAACPTSS